MNKKIITLAVIGGLATVFVGGCSEKGSTYDSEASSTVRDNFIAGTLTWSGSENGEHVYKTATCTLDMDKGLAEISMPDDVNVDFGAEPAPASLTQPVVQVNFTGANGVMVAFTPYPHNVNVKNNFLRVVDYGDGVSWEKKGDEYILHLRHFDDVANDFTKDPIQEWHVYLTGDILCAKITNP